MFSIIPCVVLIVLEVALWRLGSGDAKGKCCVDRLTRAFPAKVTNRHCAKYI